MKIWELSLLPLLVDLRHCSSDTMRFTTLVGEGTIAAHK